MDEDGYLSVSDLKQTLMGTNWDTQAQSIIQEVTKNEVNRMSYQTFKQIIYDKPVKTEQDHYPPSQNVVSGILDN